MSFSTVNDIPVVRGTLVLPRIGVWHADLELEDDSIQSGQVAIKWWDQQLELQGTVRYGGGRNGTSRVHVVGGAGGLTAAFRPKAYLNATRQLVVSNLLDAAGEKLSPRADKTWMNTQLPFWTILAMNVGDALTTLVELDGVTSWRVLADGSFWIGPEAWGSVEPEFEEVSRDPKAYQMEVSCPLPALMPGITFQGQRVSTVSYVMEPWRQSVILLFEAPEQ